MVSLALTRHTEAVGQTCIGSVSGRIVTALGEIRGITWRSSWRLWYPGRTTDEIDETAFNQFLQYNPKVWGPQKEYAKECPGSQLLYASKLICLTGNKRQGSQV